MLMEMGIDMQQFATGNEVIVWLILPMLCACTIAVVQLTISIFAGAIAGYIVSIVYLVVSVYWVSPFLMGNYLMIIRYNNGCGCRNNKLHYCDGGFYCVRKCVF